MSLQSATAITSFSIVKQVKCYFLLELLKPMTIFRRQTGDEHVIIILGDLGTKLNILNK